MKLLCCGRGGIWRVTVHQLRPSAESPGAAPRHSGGFKQCRAFGDGHGLYPLFVEPGGKFLKLLHGPRLPSHIIADAMEAENHPAVIFNGVALDQLFQGADRVIAAHHEPADGVRIEIFSPVGVIPAAGDEGIVLLAQFPESPPASCYRG